MTRWKVEAVVVALAAAAGVVAVLLGALGEADEVGDGLGSVVREQVDRDVAPVGLQDGLLVSHVCLSRVRAGAADPPTATDQTRVEPHAWRPVRVRGGARPVGYGEDRDGMGDETRGKGPHGHPPEQDDPGAGRRLRRSGRETARSRRRARSGRRQGEGRDRCSRTPATGRARAGRRPRQGRAADRAERRPRRREAAARRGQGSRRDGRRPPRSTGEPKKKHRLRKLLLITGVAAAARVRGQEAHRRAATRTTGSRRTPRRRRRGTPTARTRPIADAAAATRPTSRAADEGGAAPGRGARGRRRGVRTTSPRRTSPADVVDLDAERGGRRRQGSARPDRSD